MRRPVNTTVAICNKERTPDGDMAAKVPAKIMVAEMMTEPIFFILLIIAGSVPSF